MHASQRPGASDLPLATKKQEPWKSLLPYIYPLGDGQHPGDLLLQRIDKERNVLTSKYNRGIMYKNAENRRCENEWIWA